jgi:NAD(P)-dependent dehydrogenase (short-subunit alcohol dehydrogenase family)
MTTSQRTPVWPLLVGGLAAAYVMTHRPRRYEFRDRTVLITGGSRGLGLILARQLGHAGARVAICGRDAPTLERARVDLQARGIRALAVPCDVTVREEVDALVDRVTRELGPIDLLINNAGIITVGPAETMTPEDFEQAMATNFWGPLNAILAVLPSMRRRGEGRIANIASIGGKVSVPHLLPYSASKFALVGLSQGLRAELAGDGIQVITICPGLMRTGSPRHALFKGRRRAEYAWFSITDSLPLVSMDAERAGRQILEAIRHGDAERVLSVPAKLAALAAGVFPGNVAALLAQVDRLLPDAAGNGRLAHEGVACQSPASPSLLTALGDRAARRHNQTDAGVPAREAS